jgi:hypothetical protein
MMRRFIFGVWMALLLMRGGAGFGAETASKGVAGTTFTDIDGVAHSVLGGEGKAGTVILFLLHDCPICNGFAPEISRLTASYTNFNFFIAQVDPSLTAEAARQHAKDYALHGIICLDGAHKLVDLAGATMTPEAAVFSNDGKLLYRGRIDDTYASVGKKRMTVTKHDLREALDAVAAGKPVPNERTRAVGCYIEKLK